MNSTNLSASPLRHLPNVISGLRLASVPVLAALAHGGHEILFAWLLVAAMLTDMFDGWIARTFGLRTTLGAALDSVADLALTVVTVYGIWVFHRYVLVDHALLCGAALGLWTLEMLLSFVRYGRQSSFHTWLAKASGILLGIFFGVLFVFGYQPWLFYPAMAVTITASLEELAMLALLPQWRADVPGLWRVLRERKLRKRLNG